MPRNNKGAAREGATFLPEAGEAEAAADAMARAFEAASDRISNALSDAFSDAVTKGEADMRKLIATLVAELARVALSDALVSGRAGGPGQDRALNLTLNLDGGSGEQGRHDRVIAARHQIASQILKGLNGSGARL
jgi:hypothetical protein